MTTSKTKFREDINGLRAIAVISVIIFHFSPGKLTGGFAGVDVFFVISGYLMTSIIFRGIENQSFSFWRFIFNRAKRIIPALLVVVIILLFIGYATLSPESYKLLAKHARDSLLFISNITYKNESGYFDVESNTKFLLHTWSLSVEWQFYIVYPIILVILSKFIPIHRLKYCIIVLLILSLALSIYTTKMQPTSAYFMFYTRAWEMLFGGLAFIYPLNKINDKNRFALELIGLALICLSLVMISENTPWPGYMALLPVIGTYICILATNTNTLLSGYIINKIGLWSYSLYLVHWPILILNYTLNWNLSFPLYITIVFITAFALFQFAEKRRKYGWGMIIVFIISVTISSYIYNTNGLEKRFNIPQESLDSLQLGGKDLPAKTWKEYNLNNKKELGSVEHLK